MSNNTTENQLREQVSPTPIHQREDGALDSEETPDMDTKGMYEKLGKVRAMIEQVRKGLAEKMNDISSIDREEDEAAEKVDRAQIDFLSSTEENRASNLSNYATAQATRRSVNKRQRELNHAIKRGNDKVAGLLVEESNIQRSIEVAEKGIDTAKMVQKRLNSEAPTGRYSNAEPASHNLGWNEDVPLEVLTSLKAAGGVDGLVKQLANPNTRGVQLEGVHREVASIADPNVAGSAAGRGLTLKASVLSALQTQQRNITYANTSDAQGFTQSKIEEALYATGRVEDYGFEMYSSDDTQAVIPVISDPHTNSTQGALADGASVADPTSSLNEIQLRPNAFHEKEVWGRSANASLSGLIPALTANVIKKIDQNKRNQFLFRAVANSGQNPATHGSLLRTGQSIVSLGTNGGQLTPSQVQDLVNTVQQNNGEISKMFLLTSPLVEGTIRSSSWALESGGANVITQQNGATKTYFANVPLYANSQSPIDLTKGSGTNLAAVLCIDSSKVHFATFGGLTIIMDEYTQIGTRQVALHAITYCDLATNYLDLVGVINDARLS